MALPFEPLSDGADIEPAHSLLSPMLGAGAASMVFAAALLASGQNSTITATRAGQIGMEGFVDIRLPPGARRLALKDARTITRIPVLPISYADAEPLLRALGGQIVPDAWRGGLPLTYRFGPGPARVHLAVKSEWGIKPLYNVIARLPGGRDPDQWVVRGNHHDAWVNGAEDPVSGMVAELEEAEAEVVASFERAKTEGH